MPRVFPERSESLQRFAVHWFTRSYLYFAAFAVTRTLKRSARAPSIYVQPLWFRSIVTGMLPRIVATVSLASLCVLSLMLTFTAPVQAGPFGLLIVFISAYLTFLGVISFFLFGISHLIAMVFSGAAVRKPLKAMSFRRAYYFGAVLAAAPVMIIGLQSVKSMSVYEFLLVVLFEVVACIYVSRRFQ